MSDIMQKIILSIALIIVMVAVIVGTSMLLSCQSTPKRSNYESEIGFTMADCMYRAQKNPLACSELVKAFANYTKEKQQFNKVNFCRDIKNYLPHWNGDSEKCLLYLNQK